MEKEQQVRTFEVRYICDECKDGLMISKGISCFKHPFKYNHICDNCGHNQEFTESYPHTITR